MRLNPWGPPAIHYAGAAVFYLCALVVAFSVTGDAQQLRPLSAGVYSAEQATRGEQLYTAECAACHGVELEGSIGPPLAGELFMSNNSELPVSALVDTIQNTMPFNLPGSLSREQSIDLAAYILQGGEFPAGQAELSETDLTLVAFPATEIAALVVSGQPGSLPPPEGNLAQLMRAIAFPNSNIIFNLQIKDPDLQPRLEVEQPFDYPQWGATIYPGWLAVDQAAIALAETAPLFLTPGRRCQNGSPVPVDRDDWKGYVADLVEIAKLAHVESRARNFEAFVDISEKLNETCDACHRVYRDTGGVEGGIGGVRCQ